MRVGVDPGDAAVRRPAGVADPRARLAGHILLERGDRALRARLQGPPQARQVSDSARALQASFGEQRQPRGVIPPVLELLQCLEQQLLARTVAHISDDAAQVSLPPRPAGAAGAPTASGRACSWMSSLSSMRPSASRLDGCRVLGRVGHEHGLEVAAQEPRKTRDARVIGPVLAVVAERHGEAPGREAGQLLGHRALGPQDVVGAPGAVLLEALEAGALRYCR